MPYLIWYWGFRLYFYRNFIKHADNSYKDKIPDASKHSTILYYLPSSNLPFITVDELAWVSYTTNGSLANSWLGNECLKQYFSLYRVMSQRGRKIEARKNVQTTPSAPTGSTVGPCCTIIQITRTPGTPRLPSTITPSDHPPGQQYYSYIRTVVW